MMIINSLQEKNLNRIVHLSISFLFFFFFFEKFQFFIIYLFRLGLENLLGTNLLRAFMHGFFIDLRLYEKVTRNNHIGLN